MKKLTTILSGLAVAAFAVIYFSGCSSTVTPPSGSVSSNVLVASATTTSMTISWSRDPNDTSADTIYVTGGAQPQTVIAPSGTSSGTVTGLTTGVAYSISIGSPVGRTSPISYTIAGLPTGIMVNSMSATSIGAKWTRGASDVGADTIIAMNGSTVVGTAIASGSSGAVTGLSEGTVYTISIHNTTTATTPISMPWETAERTTGIKIYEKADPDAGDPSALVLTANGVGAVSLTGASNADFVLDDGGSSASGISFESGSVFNGSWNATYIDPDPNYIVGGLNNYYRDSNYSQDISVATSSRTNAYDIPNDAGYLTEGSRILICQTQNGNLALIEIQPDPSGTLYSTTTDGYKYITVNVSYQSMSAAPYAGRGHVRSGGLEERMSAH